MLHTIYHIIKPLDLTTYLTWLDWNFKILMTKIRNSDHLFSVPKKNLISNGDWNHTNKTLMNHDHAKSHRFRSTSKAFIHQILSNSCPNQILRKSNPKLFFQTCAQTTKQCKICNSGPKFNKLQIFSLRSN